MELVVKDTVIDFEDNYLNLNKFIDRFNLNKYFIVTDSNVYEIYHNEISKWFKDSKVIVIEAGEENKNIETVLYIINNLLAENITRGDSIIAIGGGVVSDICGFVASILYRGIKHIMIPTTLLSMVDATIGGKCGVDHAERKNIIGSFYEPKGIYITPKFLETLPKEEFESGLGEVVKYAFLDNNFKLLEEDNLINIIKESILIKKYYVEADFKDTGLRMCLNFGHTFGHAIELKKGILHGQAVLEGIKMIFDLETDLGLDVSKEKALFDALLKKFNLCVKGYNYKEYIEDIFNDKKNFNGILNIVFIKDFKPYLYKTTKGELYDKIRNK